MGRTPLAQCVLLRDTPLGPKDVGGPGLLARYRGLSLSAPPRAMRDSITLLLFTRSATHGPVAALKSGSTEPCEFVRQKEQLSS